MALLAACVGFRRVPPLALSEEQNDSGISLVVRQELVVSLEENRSAGYTWQLARLDAHVLASTADAFSGSLVGAAGMRTLTFRAILPGETRLELVYRRPSEPGSTPPAKVFAVHVIVR